MNGFTKEELGEIYYRLENAPKELENKIKLMIENYDSQSSQCPKCSNYRVQDGMSWNLKCDYKLVDYD